MKKLLYLLFLLGAFTQAEGQNNTVYGAGISYTNGAPTFTPPARTSRVAIDTITGKWYHFNTPGGWQLIGNTVEEIAGCGAPAYTPAKGDSKVVINGCPAPELYYWTGSAWVWINEGTTYFAGEGIRIENDTIILDSLELNELHDVFTPNPINNQVLTWDNIDKRWEAATVADSSPTNELQTLSTGTNTLTLSNGGGTVTVDTDPANDVTGSGAAGQVSFWTGAQTQTGDNNLRWLSGSKSLRLNSQADTTTVSLFIGPENSSSTGSIWIRSQNPNIVQEAERASGGVAYSISSGFIKNTTSNLRTKSHEIGINGNAQTVPTSPTVSYMYFGCNSDVSFSNNAFRILNNKRASFENTLTIGSTATSSSIALKVNGLTTSTSGWTAQFHNSTGSNNALMIRDDGNIGIRTNAPTDLIDINGANGYSQLRLRTTYTPTGTADANGNTGDVSWDDSYIYIKTSAGWKRSALSTF